MSDYQAFLESKTPRAQQLGFDPPLPWPKLMKPFQRDIVNWACKRGRAAIFAGTGLGKTLQELAWAQQVCEHTGGRVLIFTPLAVAEQTVREAAKFGIGGVAYALDESAIAGPLDAYYGDETTPTGPLVTETGNMRSVNHPGDDWYSVAVWQRYAEPIWMDIAQGDVLSHRVARAEEDERHISPLQLTVIRRCVQMWSNPGDVVFSPFAGIGSELYVALELGRKALGAELKKSYYDQAIANIGTLKRSHQSLFAA